MAGERILYACFDPALLLRRERMLMAQGYEVQVVLGQDGLIATNQIKEADFVLIGDEGLLQERQDATRWLKEEYPSLPVIALRRATEDLPEADYQVAAVESHAWSEAVADCIRRCRDLA